jgi:hypothetical protein
VWGLEGFLLFKVTDVDARQSKINKVDADYLSLQTMYVDARTHLLA